MTIPPVSPLLAEELIGLATLASEIASSRRDGGMSPQAVWRWATKGIGLPDGSVVKLETVRLAGRFLTSREAYKRFLARQTPDLATPPPTPVRSAGKRGRAAERAGNLLTAAGL